MKKHISNPLANALRPASLFFSVCAFLLFLAPFGAHATDPVEDTPSVRVQYSKPVNGQPVFQVTLSNDKGEQYELRITDDSGVVLYTEQIKSKQYTKRFQLATGASEDISLYVEVRPKGAKKAQGFRVEGAGGSVARDLVVSRF
jgi:hypothetical protein